MAQGAEPIPPATNTSTELAAERTSLARQRTKLAEERVSFAVERTMLGHERTLMAWARTAASLISFGFGIYTFFHNLGKQDNVQFPNATNFAIIMIVTGLLGLFVATLRYRRDVRDLQSRYGAAPRRAAPLLAGLISVFGIVGLIVVILRL